MKDGIDKIHIVLVGTTHPGNIGAAARAMKTMGHRCLRLVSPGSFPCAEATARATGADDVLHAAEVYQSLKEAVADCDLVIGATARARSIPWPVVTPRQCAENILTGNYASVAVVFGRESSGLGNAELELCNMVLSIPGNSAYRSLNLAAAVQIVCYEFFLRLSVSEAGENTARQSLLVNQSKMESFYADLEQRMSDTGFLDPKRPGRLMHRMRNLFNRAQLRDAEYNILRGFLASIKSPKNKIES